MKNNILKKIPPYEPIKEISKLIRLNGKQRFYVIENSKYKIPSVTTILNETNLEKKEKLKEWRKKIGEEKAFELTKESAGIGTALHFLLENLLKSKELKLKNNLSHKKAIDLVQKIIDEEISNWSKTLALEYKIFYPKLYAGTIDVIFEENNKLVIGDFKTARRMKSEKYIEDYKFQLTAYKYALEYHGLKVDYGKIMMITLDGDFKNFIIDDNEFRKLKKIWFGEKLIYFYDKFL